MIAELLDGVIFASDWQDHMITQGNNRRPVKRRQRPDGSYEYMELDSWNRLRGGKPQVPSDLGEVLNSGRLEDPTSRMIMADALTDMGREPEAEFLRGPRGNGAVRVDGWFRDPGDIAPAQIKAVIAAAVAQSPLRASVTRADPPYLPIGSVQVATSSSAYGFDYLSANTMVAAARQAGEFGVKRFMEAAQMVQSARSPMQFWPDGASDGGVLRDNVAGLAWLDAHHAGRGEHVSSGMRNLGDGTQSMVHIYRMPCHGSATAGTPSVVQRYYAVVESGTGTRLYLPRAEMRNPEGSSRANLEHDLFM